MEKKIVRRTDKAIATEKLAADLDISYSRAKELMAESPEMHQLRNIKLSAEIEKLDLHNAEVKADFIDKNDAYQAALKMNDDVMAILNAMADDLPALLVGLRAAAMPPLIKDATRKARGDIYAALKKDK